MRCANNHSEASMGIDEEYEARQYAMQQCNSFAFPFVLNAAVELDLFDIIAKAGMGKEVSPHEIASHLPTHNPDAPSMIDRMLCLLSSFSLLTCSLHTSEDGRTERLYGLTPAGKLFVKDRDGGSLAPLVLLGLHRVSVESWLRLKDAVLEGGRPFSMAHGMSIFDYMNINPSFNAIFSNSMANMSKIMMEKVVETYKGFDELESLVDVGGGTGATLNKIISKYPSIKGINFDLPHVVKNAPSYPGIEHVGGDMRVAVPKGNAIFIKNTFHNWSDEDCLKILKNCYEALPEKAKVIVMDSVKPEIPEPSISHKHLFQMDTIMLTQPGGKERTANELRVLAEGAGFSKFQVVCHAYTVSLLELHK